MRAPTLLFAVLAILHGQPLPHPMEAARAAEQAGRFANAEQHYMQALAVRPSAELWQRLGLVRHLQGKFDTAIEAFSRAVAADPQLWGSHLFLGIASYKTNRFPPALEALTRAQALQPGHPEVLFWLGATHLALGRHVDGLRHLEQRLAADPKNVEVLQLLASAYREYGIALWNSVAEDHFDTAAGQMVHGHALEAQGSLDQALAAYTRAAVLQPDRPGVHLAIGKTLLRQNKHAEAVTALRREMQGGGESAAEAEALLQQVAERSN